ncbi:MAG TPA: M28 family peptidase [Pirellulales bacterium]|nr:M28 family peptidase [Pirellulales bacterium]
MGKGFAQMAYLAAVLAVCAAAIGYVVWPEAQAGPRRLALKDIPFDGAQAYEYLQQICDLGPRVSGSTGMQAQQELLLAHFEQFGAETELQSFKARHPRDGSAVSMANLIARWRPERAERILLCAHYDTRPFPDRDRTNPEGTFLGANDGASGVALLMELARHVGELDGAVGIDFVLFDGEELVFGERDEYFLGSTHFARDYVANRPPGAYRWAVLLDMVADADLKILQEVNSMRWTDTRPLVESIWSTAKRLGVHEFVSRRGPDLRDDHLPLHEIARIPACDVIDFEYPAWHTQADAPAQCSALSLAKVGWVIHEWLKAEVAKPAAKPARRK